MTVQLFIGRNTMESDEDLERIQSQQQAEHERWLIDNTATPHI